MITTGDPFPRQDACAKWITKVCSNRVGVWQSVFLKNWRRRESLTLHRMLSDGRTDGCPLLAPLSPPHSLSNYPPGFDSPLPSSQSRFLAYGQGTLFDSTIFVPSPFPLCHFRLAGNRRVEVPNPEREQLPPPRGNPMVNGSGRSSNSPRPRIALSGSREGDLEGI